MNEMRRGFLYRAAERERLRDNLRAQGVEALDDNANCPTEADLVAVAFEQADSQRVAAVDKHAADCEHCGETLEALRLMIQRKTPPLEPWDDPVAVWLARGGGVTKPPTRPQGKPEK